MLPAVVGIVRQTLSGVERSGRALAAIAEPSFTTETHEWLSSAGTPGSARTAATDNELPGELATSRRVPAGAIDDH
jgi:hypothetical protein